MSPQPRANVMTPPIPAPPPQEERLQLGDAAPDFEAIGMDGQTQRLSDYRGKRVILTFNRADW